MSRNLLSLALLLPVLCLAVTTAGATQAGPETGVVTGCVGATGQGPYRGVAALWPAAKGKGPDPRLAIRPPAVSAPLQADGCFVLRGAPGDYFVGAVVRRTVGGWQGPPRHGDLVFLSPDATNKSYKATLQAGETIDIGRHADGWAYSGFTAAAEGSLTISGRLVDTKGRPLPGLLVFAFTDTDMSREPLAVSSPSDNSGNYLLRLPEPATVYLRAREHYGRRSPADGGYMGVCGGELPTPLVISDPAQPASCDMTVLHVPPAAERQNKPTGFSPAAQEK